MAIPNAWWTARIWFRIKSFDSQNAHQSLDSLRLTFSVGARQNCLSDASLK